MTASHRSLLAGLLALTGLLLLVACAESNDDDDRSERPRDSFHSQWVHGEGTVVEISGYRTGHQAGETSDFDLRLQNPTDEAWDGDYCVVLVTADGGVAEVSRDTFSLAPEDELLTTVRISFPAEAADSMVGVAIVLPERGANVVSVEVGDPSPAAGASWPPLVACPSQ